MAMDMDNYFLNFNRSKNSLCEGKNSVYNRTLNFGIIFKE
ncbi:hypothetical protein IYC_04613 [Clostridium sporogenes PA 3679]|nr:hypothetical protein IYC_04613 [Clostridium sporogenes PA 3679]